MNPIVIEAAAELISSGIGDLPWEQEAEWRNFGSAEKGDLDELLDEVSHADIMLAVRQAAARMQERSSR